MKTGTRAGTLAVVALVVAVVDGTASFLALLIGLRLSSVTVALVES